MYKKITPPNELKLYIFLQNYMTSLGLITFLLGLFFSIGKFTYYDLPSLRIPFSKMEIIDGEIADIHFTGHGIGEKEIVAYDYFINQPEIGQSYGTSFSRKIDKNIGDKIKVEYVKNHPLTHRVLGMHNSFINEVTIVFWIIWFIGLVLIILGVRNTNSFLRFVKSSYVTKAWLSKRPTSKVIDETRFLVLEFSFVTKEGKSVKINKELSNARNILDDKEELIIYSENNPNKNYFVDRLPKKLKDYVYSETQNQ